MAFQSHFKKMESILNNNQYAFFLYEALMYSESKELEKDTSIEPKD